MANSKTKSPAALLRTELMPGALSAELVGTFILTGAVIVTNGNVLVTAIAIIALVLMLSKVSGAHVNPVVTVSLWATKQISWVKALGYIVAQVLGAMLALIVVSQFLAGNTQAAASGVTAYKVPALTGTWVPVMAEALGGLVFGLGIAASFLNKKEGLESAFLIGTALLVGIVLATLGSAGVVNPAVAVGVSGYTSNNMWTYSVYAIAPIVGGAAGAWLYKLMQWDVMNMAKKK